MNTIKALVEARTRVATLEQKMRQELSTLPGQYGFDSMQSFIDALTAVESNGGNTNGSVSRGRPAAITHSRNSTTSSADSTAGGRKRRRGKITDETRAQVKKLVSDGKTGTEIAKQLKISLPSVQNIKKALGLVKARA